LIAEATDYQLGLGSATPESFGELDAVAAEAFGWAMPYVADLEG
jgi:hypothetical protein